MKEMGQNLKSAISERINLLKICKGIGISYLITIPIFVILAVILTYTSFPEDYISPAVIVTTVISILFAGSTATRNLKSKGWLNGALVGFIYMLFLYVAGSLAIRDFSVNRHVIAMALIGVLSGSIGGIIGINFRHGSHSRYKPVKKIAR